MNKQDQAFAKIKEKKPFQIFPSFLPDYLSHCHMLGPSTITEQKNVQETFQSYVR